MMELSNWVLALIGGLSIVFLVQLVGTSVAVGHLWKKSGFGLLSKIVITPPLIIIPFAEYVYFSYVGLDDEENNVPESLL